MPDLYDAHGALTKDGLLSLYGERFEGDMSPERLVTRDGVVDAIKSLVRHGSGMQPGMRRSDGYLLDERFLSAGERAGLDLLSAPENFKGLVEQKAAALDSFRCAADLIAYYRSNFDDDITERLGSANRNSLDWMHRFGQCWTREQFREYEPVSPVLFSGSVADCALTGHQAGKLHDGYASMLTAERIGRERGPWSFGVTKPGHETVFGSREMAAAYLQYQVAACGPVRGAAAAWPGTSELGISALGDRRITVETRFLGLSLNSPYRPELPEDSEAYQRKSHMEQAHGMYRDIISKDMLPGCCSHMDRVLPLENMDEFVRRCELGDNFRFARFEFDAPTPGFDDLIKSAASKDIRGGAAYAATSDMGLNTDEPVYPGMDTGHDFRDFRQYKDFMAARVRQADMLMPDLAAYHDAFRPEVLSDNCPFPTAERGTLVDNKWVSPGTQCHLKPGAGLMPAASDFAFATHRLQDNLALRAGMALYGVDLSKVPSNGLGVTENPGRHGMDGMRFRFRNGGTQHLVDSLTLDLHRFSEHYKGLLLADEGMRRAKSRDELTRDAGVIKTLDSAGRTTMTESIGSSALAEQFLCDVACRDGYVNRQAVREGHPVPSRTRLAVGGPGLSHDLVIGFGEVAKKADGREVYALDTVEAMRMAKEAFQTAPAPVPAKTKPKAKGRSRGALDAKAAEIERKQEATKEGDYGE